MYFMAVLFVDLKELLEGLILVMKNSIKFYKKSGIQHRYHSTVCMPGCEPNHG